MLLFSRALDATMLTLTTISSWLKTAYCKNLKQE